MEKHARVTFGLIDRMTQWLPLVEKKHYLEDTVDSVRRKRLSNISYVFSLEEQVLTRFEEENGGQIVVGTVCLLETSRHGLLETELLQMLADESTLTPPPYIEGESDQITITQADQTDAGLFGFQFVVSAGD